MLPSSYLRLVQRARAKILRWLLPDACHQTGLKCNLDSQRQWLPRHHSEILLVCGTYLLTQIFPKPSDKCVHVYKSIHV